VASENAAQLNGVLYVVSDVVAVVVDDVAVAIVVGGSVVAVCVIDDNFVVILA